MPVSTPHFRTPFSVAPDGTVPVVEQGLDQEVAQCVAACLSTPKGSLADLPEFGIPDPTFKQQTLPPSVADVMVAVEEAEPRAALLEEIEVEELVERVRVEVSATNG